MEAAIRSGDLRLLFIEHLGWDHLSGQYTLKVEGETVVLDRVAHKRGVAVFRHEAPRPLVQLRGFARAIQAQLARVAHEHILVLMDPQRQVQIWAWAVRAPGTSRLLLRLHPFFTADVPPRFLRRIQRLAFTLEEEESISVIDVVDRMASSFDGRADQTIFFRRPEYALEGERLLRELQSGGKQAMDAFLAFHRPLTVWFAKRYQRLARSRDDVEQVAMIGLMRAAKLYNPVHGAAFSTYAYRAMQTECWRLLPLLNPLGAVPHYVYKQAVDLRGAAVRRRRAGDMRRWASLLIDAGATQGHDFAMVETLRRFTRRRPVWLSTPRSSSREAGAWDYTDREPMRDRTPLSELLLRERDERLHAAIARLEAREQLIIRQRFGLDGNETTLKEIGDDLGLTRERIRQIEAKILETLKPMLLADEQPSQRVLDARAAKPPPHRGPRRGLYLVDMGPDGKPVFGRIVPRRGQPRERPMHAARPDEEVSDQPTHRPDPDFWTPDGPTQLHLW